MFDSAEDACRAFTEAVEDIPKSTEEWKVLYKNGVLFLLSGESLSLKALIVRFVRAL